MTRSSGGAAVVDIRLTALADAIRARDWARVEFEYDRVRSSLDRELGIRERLTDRLQSTGRAGITVPCTVHRLRRPERGGSDGEG